MTEKRPRSTRSSCAIAPPLALGFAVSLACGCFRTSSRIDAGTCESARCGASAAGRDAARPDAGSNECDVDGDCELESDACCSCEPARTVEVVAVKRGSVPPHAQPCASVECGGCGPVVVREPVPVVRAVCVAKRCAVVDLREQPESACTRDADCHLVSQGCCGSCGPDPTQWIALSVATADPHPQPCQALGSCTLCLKTSQPAAYCANDQHCAVREVPRVQGVESSTCFSATQNLEHAYDPGAIGCDCVSPFKGGLCARDAAGQTVQLFCSQQWIVQGMPNQCHGT